MTAKLYGEDAAQIVLQQCLHAIDWDVTRLIEDFYEERSNRAWNDNTTKLNEDAQASIRFALDMVHQEAQRGLAPGLTLNDREEHWWNIASVIDLAARAYPKNASSNANRLEAMVRDAQAYPGLWMAVADMGKKAQKEVECESEK